MKQVKMGNQVDLKERWPTVSGIFHLSTKAKEQAVTRRYWWWYSHVTGSDVDIRHFDGVIDTEGENSSIQEGL